MGGRPFFVIMASAVIVAVFAGFAPTFYLRGSFPQDRPMSFLLHVHGIAFSAWVCVFLVRTLLIARGSRGMKPEPMHAIETVEDYSPSNDPRPSASRSRSNLESANRM